MPGPLALVGSGEYLPVMAELERSLISGRPPRYVQIPTAAAHEGAASLDRWIELGRLQAERLGVEAVPVVVRDRAEADDPEVASQILGAGLIYLSGGSPTLLAEKLRGTAVAAAIEATWRGGAALAGCSAGAMALTSWVPSLRKPGHEPVHGLGLVPHLRVIPHFDRFERWMPDLAGRYLARAPEGTAVVGIDEDTALVWDQGRWTVRGLREVWLLRTDGRTAYGVGAVLELPPVP
ncbi:MAG: Type 1 glutamine amidotransferase-like domain-containing protein [Frankiaceae bacterium]|nr:Type 1 glutamine amidotransferase-like domain-containing protein [Frankiaceae bacterium]